MRYKAIIFDVGDTLLEHYPSENQIYISRVASLGFSISDSDAVNISNAIRKAAQDQILKEQYGSPRISDMEFTTILDRAALNCVYSGVSFDEYIVNLYHCPLPQQELRVIEGTEETLQKLQAKKLRLAIVSNHRAWLPEYLKEIGLAQYFNPIIVSDIVGVEKPDIRIMQIALDDLSLDASSCLYVGDHPFDVLCSKKAGMDCAWISAPENTLPDTVTFSEDYRIQSTADLLTIL